MRGKFTVSESPGTSMPSCVEPSFLRPFPRPPRPGRSLTTIGVTPFSVPGRQEQIAPVVAAVEDMVNRVRKYDSQFSRHNSRQLMLYPEQGSRPDNNRPDPVGMLPATNTELTAAFGQQALKV